ncbi:hypothetical protein IFM89_018178 [Coptis chinensis]|uniref:Non-haem dioxygenase N-terminal domain-containing protein n=1 Tax=Coptis chinensis TaxID=261450 RepID=A0A835LW46_9MAGN|nr:hypothetical protein IFM89_018178 [Coptis chinensis]
MTDKFKNHGPFSLSSINTIHFSAQHSSYVSLLMDTSAPTLLCLPMELKNQRDNRVMVFDSSLLQKLNRIPREFHWPPRDLVNPVQELSEPLVDLQGVFKGDQLATSHAAELIREACLKHGFFQVINHGVDAELITAAHDHLDAFFKLPTCQKLRVVKKPGSTWGYSGAHANRFSSKLPWKETLSFGYHENESNPIVVDYFTSALGVEFEQTG